MRVRPSSIGELNMDEVAGRKAVACLAAVWLLVAAAPGDSQPVADRPGLEDLADRAVAAANAGQLAEALKLYRELEQSADSSLSWAGVSGQVIVHRMAGDGASARLVTQRVGAERPELAGLMAVWDGDTAMVEKDVERALGEYRRAADIHGTQVVDGRPVGVTALRQLSRAHLEKRDASAAAEAERELARRFPRFVDREEAAGRILAFEAMAAGELPLKPMARLLEDGDCSPKRPCVFGRGGVVQHGSPPADAKPLAGQQGLFVTADAEAAAGFDDGPNVPAEAPPASTALACTTTTAYSGFVNPMNGVKGGGFAFMETPDCCGGWHTGIDLNRGGFQQDCDDPFYSAAEGCVMDVMSSTSDWGSAAIEHFYPPSLWTSQYGHAHEVYVSVGQWVRRGKLIGRVGDTGTGACHLHFEIREPDHTTRNDAGSYHNASQSMVGDEYQDPLPFIAAHKRYTSVMPRDEDTFSFTPAASWTLVTTAGDNDDMRWALTTPVSPKTTYARHTVTAPSGGTWELWAFIPYANRSSTAVPYTLTRLSDGVQMFRATINQSDKNDAWVRVGSAALTAGVQYRIEVATNTGETGRRVAVDDFLLIKPDLAARANLAVSGITFTRTPANGIRTTAIASLANTGSVASGTFNVKWFVDDLDDGLSPVLTGYGGHESLAPGQVSSGNVRFDWTPTASSAVACPNGPSGTYCTHALEFYADVDGHVIEADELNNVFRLELRVRNPADLKVSGITFTSPPKFGVRTTAVAQLSNVGATASGAFAVKWFLDGVQVGYGGHTSLAPGEVSSGNVRYDWTPAAGQHTLQFVADVNAQVAESNESNNSASVSVNITAPDLRVGSITLFPSPPLAGVPTTATAYLVNQGTAASGTFNVKWFLDGVQRGYGGHASLAPGEVSAGNVRFSWTPTVGQHTLRFEADVDHSVLESNERNNTGQTTVNVVTRPDLVVTGIGFSDSTPVVGQRITVTATLSNTGGTSSGVFNCKWFLDGVQAGYFSQTVAAGATVYPAIPWTPPAMGTYYWRFVADVDGHVAESNESNNSYTRSVTVGCSTPPCPTFVPAPPGEPAR
jgi:subtilase family serine protease/murein DD-endopeptidase MepM/ murein hydrolase activator NlpD